MRKSQYRRSDLLRGERIPADLLVALPKTDLHCHLDGSLRMETFTELGERVGVAIVRKAELSDDDVKDHCRAHLARFKVPEQIAFVDEIPHTALWKVSRSGIRELIVRETARLAKR